MVSQPLWTARDRARQVIKKRSYSYRNVGIELREIIADPILLQWHTHADQHDMGLERIDLCYDGLVGWSVMVEISMVRFDHQVGEPPPQSQRCLLRNCRGCPKKKEPTLVAPPYFR